MLIASASERRPSSHKSLDHHLYKHGNIIFDSPCPLGTVSARPLSAIIAGHIPMGIRENQSRRCHSFQRRSVTDTGYSQEVYRRSEATCAKIYIICEGINSGSLPYHQSRGYRRMCTHPAQRGVRNNLFCALSYSPQNVDLG